MKWREIAEKEVKSAILQPESIVDSIKGRKNAFKHIGSKYLKVTFIQEKERMVVITLLIKINRGMYYEN